jgi:hypothetical protein
MNKLTILFCACFLGSCSSTRPNNLGVDQEAIALDLDACLAQPKTCFNDETKVFPIDYVVPGTRSVSLEPGGSISAPLVIPPNAKKLTYLVIGEGAPYPGSTLQVDVTRFPSQRVSPYVGPNRTEIQLQTPDGSPGIVSVEGDRITITNDKSSKDPFIIIWVLGRWAD